jgi:hypothetical protein
MAKSKRSVVGSVCKSKEAGRPDYIKIRDELTLRKGQILRLESKKFQLESLDSAVSSGKLSSDLGDKIRDRIEKIPDWVRFEIVAVETVE